MSRPHLWVRAEPRAGEARVGLMPDGAKALIEAGFRVTVEASETRAIPTDAYAKAGAEIAPAHGWPEAPQDAIIFAKLQWRDLQ